MSARVLTQGGGTGGASASIFVAGLDENSLVKATCKVLNPAIRALPDGYTQVSYIENTGTQYTDTGYTPNQNTKIVVDFSPTTSAPRIFGVRVGYANRCFLAMVKSGGIINAQVASTTEGIDIDLPNFTVNIGQRVTLSLDKYKLVCDGVEKEFTFTSEFTAHATMPLFGLKLGSDMSVSSGIRIYACQIYDNGDLVRDFVPCINGGTAGLYDLANGVFYGNAGSGAFVAGEEVPQYIDGNPLNGVWNATQSRFEITKIKSYGMWTVTATNGEKTKTQDVLVDAAIEFEIELSYSA